GYCSNAAASGYNSNAAASGYRSTAAASGDCSTAVVTGNRAIASAHGKDCIAIGWGGECKAMGAKGAWLVLSEHYAAKDGIKAAVMVYVDGKTIMPDTLYQLVDGKVKEAKNE
ncbi:MAG: hypothetical protein RR232_08665, partial [Clostridia bacterium]